MRTRRSPLALVTLALGVVAMALLVFAATRWAAGSPPAPSASPADGTDALRGPEVSGAAARPTLVSRDFDGRVRPLEAHPAEAAVALLDLDEEAQRRVATVLDERARALDAVVMNNLETLTQIETAAENGQVLTLLKIAWQLHREFRAEYGTQPVHERLAASLPADQAAELERLVDEYVEALVRAETGEDANRVDRYFARRGVMIELFAKDVERAFQRISMDDPDGAEAFERLLGRLEPTGELEARIREMAERFYFETRGMPSKQDEVELIMGIYDTLDDARQRRLVELLVSMDD